jgi:hypothetical protein
MGAVGKARVKCRAAACTALKHIVKAAESAGYCFEPREIDGGRGFELLGVCGVGFIKRAAAAQFHAIMLVPSKRWYEKQMKIGIVLKERCGCEPSAAWADHIRKFLDRPLFILDAENSDKKHVTIPSLTFLFYYTVFAVLIKEQIDP